MKGVKNELETSLSTDFDNRIGQWLWDENNLKQKNGMEAKMFQDPNMIYMIAKQKHEMMMAEIERKQRYLSLMVPIVKKRPLGRIMLKIAGMFVGIGMSMERRWGKRSGESEDICSEPNPQPGSDPDA